jgi:WD40 repeat protein
MMILKGPRDPVQAIVFSPDATTLYATHRSEGVHVWNMADHTGTRLDIDERPVYGDFLVHPNGRWAFGQHRSVRNASCAIDLNGPRAKSFNFVNSWDHLAVSPDGRLLVTVGFAKATRTVAHGFGLFGWKMAGAGPRRAWAVKPPDDALPWAIAFVDNATFVTEDRLPAKYSKAYKADRPDHRLAVRSAADGAVIATLDSPYEGYESRHLFASPDGKQFVARRGTVLWVYNPTDWQKPPTVVAGKDSYLLRAAAFHPSGRYLLLASDGPSVTAFDTSTWKPAHRWNWKAGVLRAVAVSRDGTLAAAAGPRGDVVVWDLDL